MKPFVNLDARQDVFTVVPFLTQPVEINNVQVLVTLIKVDRMTITFPLLCLVIYAVIKSKTLFFNRILHAFKSMLK